LKLGAATKKWLLWFDLAMLALLISAGAAAEMGWLYYVAVLAVAAHLKWQESDVDLDNPEDCKSKFRSNRFIGWILLAGIVLGRLWS
jgi:4-hydroxybenzoate polyprenyltransferase